MHSHFIFTALQDPFGSVLSNVRIQRNPFGSVLSNVPMQMYVFRENGSQWFTDLFSFF